MRIQFKATKQRSSYWSQDYRFEDGDAMDIHPGIAKRLIEHFPDNFRAIDKMAVPAGKTKEVTIGGIIANFHPLGGNRRFLEIGNVFLRRKVNYVLFCKTKNEQRLDWFDYKGEIRDWSDIRAEYLLMGDCRYFDVLKRVEGKVFIYVIAGGEDIKAYQALYGKHPFILNSRIFKKYFPEGHLVEGGINTEFFHLRKRRVLFQDRVNKNSEYIRGQLENIPNLELRGLNGLTNEQMREAYHKGDYFVAWESREGWCNCAAEAIACGVPVVTNGVNCELFGEQVIKVKDLRRFFLDPMGDFSWERVADKLIKVFGGEKVD